MLDNGRIEVAAQCLGMAEAAMAQALAYAKTRVIGGEALSDRQGIRWMIADMGLEYRAALLLAQDAARQREAAATSGVRYSLASSMAKLAASEAAGQVIDHLLHHLDGPAAHIGKAFNVNSPDVPIAEHHGLRYARLAHFGAVQAKIGETGEGYVTMEFNPPEAHPKPDSDAALLSQGWSTVTVLAPPARVEAPGLAPGAAW